MIYFRGKSQLGLWSFWDSAMCAETVQDRSEKLGFQFIPWPETLGLDVVRERMNWALEVLERHGIEGASLDEVALHRDDRVYLAISYKSVPCITTTGLASFKPLVHALIRAVRDDNNFKWALLEGVASAVSQRKDQALEFTMPTSGSTNWLTEYAHPELWVDSFLEVFVNSPTGHSPLFWSAIAHSTGKMPEIREKWFQNVDKVKPPMLSGLSPFQAISETRYFLTDGGRTRPFAMNSKYGCIYWLPEEWYKKVEYTFK